MEILYSLGITEENIKAMVNMYPNIKELNKQEIENKINILKNINCTNTQIKNIILSNPKYLYRNDFDILNLIKKLLELKLVNINLLLDSNPYILNIDSYEIEEYIKKEINSGKKLEDIITEIEINSFIIDEI